MSNVNHRYSSESWTLDLSGKRSPLSRWTGRDVLRDEAFRLSLLGAAAGVAPVVWLSGDRACFEDLHKAVESYVQQGLSQPVLAAQSTFPTVSLTASPTPSSSPVAPISSQFILEAQGLLRHSLNYRPQDSSSPRQMQLSMLQLADLLAVLDQWQTETLALPERQTGLRVLPGGRDLDFVVPTWGRIAASLVIAVGVTGIGGYILSRNLPSSDQQVALETAPGEGSSATDPAFGVGPDGSFGQFPIASGPPITSQAQPGDAAFADPLILPQDAQTPPPPGIGFPAAPLPPTVVSPAGGSSGLGSSAPPSSADLTIAGVGARAGSSASSPSQSPSPSFGLGNARPETAAKAPPFAEPTLADRPLLDSQPKGDRETAADTVEGIAAAPPLIQAPQAESSAQIAQAPTAATSRGGQPIPESSRQGPAAAPPAPPVPQVSVARPLPGNNQSRAVQAYLQSQWKPPAAIKQPLQYRLSVSPEGKLASVEALSPTAQLYVTDAKLPPVGSAISGAADTVQSTMVVTLTPSGQVNVAVEKTTPVSP